jgi:hypothetical protein
MFLCLIKHHAIKCLGECRYNSSFSLVGSLRWVACHLTPGERAPSTHLVGASVGHRPSLNVMVKEKFLSLSLIEPKFFGSLVCSLVTKPAELCWHTDVYLSGDWPTVDVSALHSVPAVARGAKWRQGGLNVAHKGTWCCVVGNQHLTAWTVAQPTSPLFVKNESKTNWCQTLRYLYRTFLIIYILCRQIYTVYICLHKIYKIDVNYNNISYSVSTLVLQEEFRDHTIVKRELKQEKAITEAR